MDKGKAGLTDGSSVTLLWGQDLLGLSEEAGRAVGRSEGLLGTVQHQQILATPLYFAGSGRRKGNTDSLSDKETGLSFTFSNSPQKSPSEASQAEEVSAGCLRSQVLSERRNRTHIRSRRGAAQRPPPPAPHPTSDCSV